MKMDACRCVEAGLRRVVEDVRDDLLLAGRAQLEVLAVRLPAPILKFGNGINANNSEVDITNQEIKVSSPPIEMVQDRM